MKPHRSAQKVLRVLASLFLIADSLRTEAANTVTDKVKRATFVSWFIEINVGIHAAR